MIPTYLPKVDTRLSLEIISRVYKCFINSVIIALVTSTISLFVALPSQLLSRSLLAAAQIITNLTPPARIKLHPYNQPQALT